MFLIFSKNGILFVSPNKRNRECFETSENSQKDSVIIESEIKENEESLFFYPNESMEEESILGKISESTMENIVNDSLNFTEQDPSIEFQLHKTKSKASIDSSANYVSEESRRPFLTTIKTFHGNQSLGYFEN